MKRVPLLERVLPLRRVLPPMLLINNRLGKISVMAMIPVLSKNSGNTTVMPLILFNKALGKVTIMI